MYCEFRASATSVGSLKRFPSDLRTVMSLWPDFFLFYICILLVIILIDVKDVVDICSV